MLCSHSKELKYSFSSYQDDVKVLQENVKILQVNPKILQEIFNISKARERNSIKILVFLPSLFNLSHLFVLFG